MWVCLFVFASVLFSEDALDKKQLPKVMQLRRGEFGRGGRVKHTHLVDADTSDPLHPWALNAKEPIGKKLAAKAGGTRRHPPSFRPSSSGGQFIREPGLRRVRKLQG